MRARVVIAVLAAFAIACGTSMMMMDGGTDGSSGDASIDAEAGMGPQDTGALDTGKDAYADCGTTNVDDAGTCEQVTKCSADMPGDAAGCFGELDGACRDPYILLVQCTRKYTVCNPATCRTDPIKTGMWLQQNCANQQAQYDNCKN